MSSSLRQTVTFVLAGLFGGLAGGVFGAAPGTQCGESSAVSSSLEPLVGKVEEVARACGVYGLTGSPAVVALSAGIDGHLVRAAIESEIFGGDEAERCVLHGIADVPMNSDGLRVVLPMFAPAETEGPMASR